MIRLLVVLWALSASAPAAAALTQLQKACKGGAPSRVISACTKLIAAGSSNENLIATYYANRGDAFTESSNCEAAIADYSSAMQWWPQRDATYDSYYLPQHVTNAMR